MLGGTLLIFERESIQFAGKPPPYGMLSMLLFFRSFRLPSVDEQLLTTVGFVNITLQRISLETSFTLITAQAPGIKVH